MHRSEVGGGNRDPDTLLALSNKAFFWSLFPLKFSNANRGAGTTRFAVKSMVEARQSCERCRIGLGTLPFDGFVFALPSGSTSGLLFTVA
jgi:hypothetical protein